MEVILYTLPNCSICKMVKTKLEQKNINFIEKDFSLIAEVIQSDRAPVLKIIKDGEITLFNSPTNIINWINIQG